MPTSEDHYVFRAMARRLVLILCLISIGPQSAAAPTTFPELVYPKSPDQTLPKSDEVQKIASSLNRPCTVQTAVAWTSANVADDLKKLSNAMMSKLSAFEDVSERVDFPHRPAGSGQRLYLAQSRKSGAPFTFLWIAGKNDVSLQICGDQQQVGGKNSKFDECVTSTRGPGSQPLTKCPPQVEM